MRERKQVRDSTEVMVEDMAKEDGRLETRAMGTWPQMRSKMRPTVGQKRRSLAEDAGADWEDEGYQKEDTWN